MCPFIICFGSFSLIVLRDGNCSGDDIGTPDVAIATMFFGDCVLFAFLFWIVAKTMIYTTLYVVSIVTAMNLCEFLVDAPYG